MIDSGDTLQHRLRDRIVYWGLCVTVGTFLLGMVAFTLWLVLQAVCAGAQI